MAKVEAPKIYRYHDYRKFLSDLIAFRKQQENRFSLRALCQSAGVSVAFFSMVLSEQRNLTEAVMKKIVRKLGLSDEEVLYLKLLMQLTDSNHVNERIQALKKLQKFAQYQAENQNELEAFKYLTKWYYVAIRELAHLPQFVEDVDWIQKTLTPKITPQQIREALQYLKQEKFLILGPGGKLVPSEKIVDCLGGVYRLSLSQYHTQMFEHAVESIHSATRDERMILGHTLCVSKEGYEKISELINETLKKVQAIETQDQDSERLYHVSLAAFPLSRKLGEQS